MAPPAILGMSWMSFVCAVTTVSDSSFTQANSDYSQYSAYAPYACAKRSRSRARGALVREAGRQPAACRRISPLLSKHPRAIAV